MAVGIEDIKFEQVQPCQKLADMRAKLLPDDPGDHRLPVFENSLSIPLKTIDEYRDMEQKLSDYSTRKYFACVPC